MISHILLRNFKAFKKDQINLKPLTLISGLNNTGKSCFFQPLLLLRQSYQQGFLPSTGLTLNGDLVEIGKARDTLCEDATENEVEFEIVFDESLTANWRFNCKRKTADILPILSSMPEEVYLSSLFNNDFYFIRSDRNNLNQCLQFLEIHGEEPVHQAALCHPNSQSVSLIHQVQAWLQEISPGINLKVEHIHRLGVGIKYILPMLVTILTAKSGSLIVLEHPETYLHSKSESKMGLLLSLAASCGIQIIVETHSDHIFNGIRLAVRDQKLNFESVAIHYCYKESYYRPGYSFEISSPKIDRDGRIDEWPDGFFDQWEIDLMQLLG